MIRRLRCGLPKDPDPNKVGCICEPVDLRTDAPYLPARAHVSRDKLGASELSLLVFCGSALFGLGFVCALAIAPWLLRWLS